MPSIIDQIAADLSISSASVSRALNDRPGVSADLRTRILERARELNYTPAITARGLATSRTFSLGFFVREKQGLSTATDPFYGEILHGVEQACARSDYHLAIATLNDATFASPGEFRFVRERRIDGMILAGPDIPNDFIVAMLQTGMPVVLVDNRLDFSKVNCVNSDDEQGAFLAAQHLIRLGHRQIGVLSGPLDWTSNARRVRGYRLAAMEADLSLKVIHAEQTTIDSGAEACQRLMAKNPELTAICAVNDSMAIGAIRWLQKDGVQVPEDISVVGFDDIQWASLSNPPLTTLAIPKMQMGKEAGNRLIALLNDPDTVPIEVIISVEFIQRESTHACV